MVVAQLLGAFGNGGGGDRELPRSKHTKQIQARVCTLHRSYSTMDATDTLNVCITKTLQLTNSHGHTGSNERRGLDPGRQLPVNFSSSIV